MTAGRHRGRTDLGIVDSAVNFVVISGEAAVQNRYVDAAGALAASLQQTVGTFPFRRG